ncbi:MAG: nucleotide exchange factor GrpE [Planctomycetaceae bacterium]|jgi:hypothetical protein|nr:nucleotide exchange factor GrpE [Planctomycetaceae bacterium]
MSNDNNRKKYYLFSEQDLLQVFHIFQSENIGQIFDIFQKHSLGQIIDIFQEHEIGHTIDIFQDKNIGQIIDIFQKEDIGQIIDVFQRLNTETAVMEQKHQLTQTANNVHESEQEITQAQQSSEVDELESDFEQDITEPEQEVIPVADDMEAEEEIGGTEEKNEEIEEEKFDIESSIDNNDNNRYTESDIEEENGFSEDNTDDEEENEDDDSEQDFDTESDTEEENGLNENNTDDEEEYEEEEDDDNEQDSDEDVPEISEQHYQLLQQFHDWLSLLESETETSYDETGPKIGLYQLYEALIAQRQELKLYTKSGRQLQELIQQSLNETIKATDALNRSRREQSEKESQNAKPFLSSIMEIDESLQRTSAAWDSLQIRINAFIHDHIETLTEEYCRQLSWWGRYRKRKTIRRFVDYIMDEQTNEIFQILNAFRQGFAILIQRMDNVLKKHTLERINPIGQSVDPETMQVIAVVETEAIPAGCVVDVLRFGYIWQGQVFRFADVRAAVKG